MRKELLLAMCCAVVFTAGCKDSGRVVSNESSNPAPSAPDTTVQGTTGMALGDSPDTPVSSDTNTPPKSSGTPTTPTGTTGQEPSTSGSIGKPTVPPVKPPTVAPKGSLTLRFKPAKGQYKFRNEIKQQQTMGGQTTDSKQEFTQVVKVQGAAAPYTLDFSVVSPKITMGGKGGTKSQADMIEKSMLNLKYSAKVSELAKMNSGDVGAGDEFSKALATGMVNAGMGFMGIEFPKEEVQVGSEWETVLDMGKMLGPIPPNAIKSSSGLKIPIKYRILSIDSVNGKQVVTIGMTMVGKAEFELNIPAGTGGNANQTPQKMSMNMNSTGEFKIDAASGLPLSSKSKSTVDVDAGMFKTTQKQDSTMKRV